MAEVKTDVGVFSSEKAHQEWQDRHAAKLSGKKAPKPEPEAKEEPAPEAKPEAKPEKK